MVEESELEPLVRAVELIPGVRPRFACCRRDRDGEHELEGLAYVSFYVDDLRTLELMLRHLPQGVGWWACQAVVGAGEESLSFIIRWGEFERDETRVRMCRELTEGLAAAGRAIALRDARR